MEQLKILKETREERIELLAKVSEYIGSKRIKIRGARVEFQGGELTILFDVLENKLLTFTRCNRVPSKLIDIDVLVEIRKELIKWFRA